MTKKLVAITGGIGSGKSTVSKILTESGKTVYSADGFVQKLYKKRSFVKEIKQLFPSAVKGKIFYIVDKSVIAKEVFSDKDKLEKLNSLTHERVLSEILKKMKKRKETCFAEIPILFEGGNEKYFDKVIVVKRDLDSRIKSVMRRSGLTEAQVTERIKNQFDYDTKDYGSDKYIVLVNDGDKQALKEKVQKIIKEL